MNQKYNFIHERGDYPPLAVEEIGSSWSKDVKKTMGDVESPVFMIYKDGWTRIYGYQKRYQKIVNHIFDKISRDKNYTTKIKKTFDQKAKEFLSFVKKIDKKDWSQLTNQELIRIKEKYVKLYHEIVPYGEPLPYFLKEKLQEILDEYLVKEKKVSERNYQILMTPLYQSFLNRETEELWNITKKHKQNMIELAKAIKKHQNKYAWILFDYASLICDENYFLKKAKDYPKKPPKIINYDKLKKDKQNIIKKYKIKPTYKYYLNILEDLFYLMDKKKEVLTQCHFIITSLYQEVANRLNISLDNIRWFLWEEVKQALIKNKKLSLKLAKQRRKLSATEYINGRALFLDLKKVDDLISNINKDEKSLIDQSEIKGISASSGITTGKICYLKSARENSKIKQGQILLVSNTTPDFMPAIQKAKAIITNEGGITCHAAVVSRELGIPCIVGTKIATKVLKDGDLVEVDANKGVVRIIKK